jgi:hypothetical protein
VNEPDPDRTPARPRHRAVTVKVDDSQIRVLSESRRYTYRARTSPLRTALVRAWDASKEGKAGV